MATTAVIAEIDSLVVQKASEVLSDRGLTASDILRLALEQVAEQKSLPWDVHAPNAETIAAMRESDRAEGRRYASADELFQDLGVQ